MSPKLKNALDNFKRAASQYADECKEVAQADRSLKELYLEMFQTLIADNDALKKRVEALEFSRQSPANV